MKLPKLIKAEMRKKGISQQSMADEFGVTRQFINNMLSGRDKLSNSWLLKILGFIKFTDQELNIIANKMESGLTVLRVTQ